MPFAKVKIMNDNILQIKHAHFWNQIDDILKLHTISY